MSDKDILELLAILAKDYTGIGVEISEHRRKLQALYPGPRDWETKDPLKRRMYDLVDHLEEAETAMEEADAVAEELLEEQKEGGQGK